MKTARNTSANRYRAISRKAAIRNSPIWMDALDLPSDPRNAAEVWAASLPTVSELAIRRERERRDARTYAAPSTMITSTRDHLDSMDTMADRRRYRRSSLSSAVMVLGVIALSLLATGLVRL